MSWNVEFYKDENGKEFIEEFLKSLPGKHAAKISWEIQLLRQRGIGLKEPYVKHIEGELWELRIKFASDISRIMYFIYMNKTIVLLHGFIKKTDKTPQKEIEIAKKRYNDYKNRGKYEL